MPCLRGIAIPLVAMAAVSCSHGGERMACTWQGNGDLTGYGVSVSAATADQQLVFLHMSGKAPVASDRPAGVCELNSRAEGVAPSNSTYARAQLVDTSNGNRATIEYRASENSLYIGNVLTVCNSGMLPQTIELEASSTKCVVHW